MLCPFRTNTIVEIKEDLYSKSITKREVYPDCEGCKCPYYIGRKSKAKCYTFTIDHCRLVDKQIRGV